MVIIHDGHVHSPYCPHGSKDSLHKYCEAAIENQIQGITFAEHAPLPPSFVDPTPQKDSAMSRAFLEDYIKEVQAIKQFYKGKLNVYLGLEIDFIEGFEKEISDFLNEVGPVLDDSILSVHFLKVASDYLCIDYSPEVFGDAIVRLGSVEAVYKLYYDTVAKSIETDLGPFHPKRIGHITLARKFHKKFPISSPFTDETLDILKKIKKKGYELDYNGAGCIKPLCREPYPSNVIIDQAISLDIPLVYGSDAHQASSLLSGYQQLSPNASLKKPQILL
ncbi:histidinol-phosphatase HisJ [Halalkalibacter kiskunsagensis]|uniref:Histidinol-phosphatase n=1 Tax=Halalkalibacter kiskunsagensis TaxID=1548599 RepID=A0ABV6KIU4_9BACI